MLLQDILLVPLALSAVFCIAKGQLQQQDLHSQEAESNDDSHKQYIRGEGSNVVEDQDSFEGDTEAESFLDEQLGAHTSSARSVDREAFSLASKRDIFARAPELCDHWICPTPGSRRACSTLKGCYICGEDHKCTYAVEHKSMEELSQRWPRPQQAKSRLPPMPAANYLPPPSPKSVGRRDTRSVSPAPERNIFPRVPEFCDSIACSAPGPSSLCASLKGCDMCGKNHRCTYLAARVDLKDLSTAGRPSIYPLPPLPSPPGGAFPKPQQPPPKGPNPEKSSHHKRDISPRNIEFCHRARCSRPGEERGCRALNGCDTCGKNRRCTYRSSLPKWDKGYPPTPYWPEDHPLKDQHSDTVQGSSLTPRDKLVEREFTQCPNKGCYPPGKNSICSSYPGCGECGKDYRCTYRTSEKTDKFSGLPPKPNLQPSIQLQQPPHPNSKGVSPNPKQKVFRREIAQCHRFICKTPGAQTHCPSIKGCGLCGEDRRCTYKVDIVEDKSPLRITKLEQNPPGHATSKKRRSEPEGVSPMPRNELFTRGVAQCERVACSPPGRSSVCSRLDGCDHCGKNYRCTYKARRTSSSGSGSQGGSHGGGHGGSKKNTETILNPPSPPPSKFKEKNDEQPPARKHSGMFEQGGSGSGQLVSLDRQGQYMEPKVSITRQSQGRNSADSGDSGQSQRFDAKAMQQKDWVPLPRQGQGRASGERSGSGGSRGSGADIEMMHAKGLNEKKD